MLSFAPDFLFILFCIFFVNMKVVLQWKNCLRFFCIILKMLLSKLFHLKIRRNKGRNFLAKIVFFTVSIKMTDFWKDELRELMTRHSLKSLNNNTLICICVAFTKLTSKLPRNHRFLLVLPTSWVASLVWELSWFFRICKRFWRRFSLIISPVRWWYRADCDRRRKENIWGRSLYRRSGRRGVT